MSERHAVRDPYQQVATASGSGDPEVAARSNSLFRESERGSRDTPCQRGNRMGLMNTTFEPRAVTPDTFALIH